eukprot:893800-Amphidinium_carterae.1
MAKPRQLALDADGCVERDMKGRRPPPVQKVVRWQAVVTERVLPHRTRGVHGIVHSTGDAHTWEAEPFEWSLRLKVGVNPNLKTSKHGPHWNMVLRLPSESPMDQTCAVPGMLDRIWVGVFGPWEQFGGLNMLTTFHSKVGTDRIKLERLWASGAGSSLSSVHPRESFTLLSFVFVIVCYGSGAVNISISGHYYRINVSILEQRCRCAVLQSIS